MDIESMFQFLLRVLENKSIDPYLVVCVKFLYDIISQVGEPFIDLFLGEICFPYNFILWAITTLLE
jgi:hypothetical protein